MFRIKKPGIKDSPKNESFKLYYKDETMPQDKRIFYANTFQTPNFLVDEILKDLTGNELKIYLVILRKTRGWNKTTDFISNSQISQLTGIKDFKTIRAVRKKLSDMGLIQYNLGGGRKLNEYSIQLNSPENREEIDRGENLVGGEKQPPCWGENSHLRGGGNLPPQNPIKPTNQNHCSSSEHPQQDIESQFTSTIQEYSLKIKGSKLRLGFGTKELGELVNLCDGNIELLKAKLDDYYFKKNNNHNEYFRKNSFSLGLLLQVWDNLEGLKKAKVVQPFTDSF